MHRRNCIRLVSLLILFNLSTVPVASVRPTAAVELVQAIQQGRVKMH